MKQQDLVQVLDAVPAPTQVDATGAPCLIAAEVLIDRDHSDDAAVVRGTGERSLVLTTDVIAPIVDDPEVFGAIAATNALSDVWAMGGQPRFALALAFFPDDQLPLAVLSAILRGGADACARAGVAIVGGHTVRDAECKYGLAVTGEVAADEVLSNRGALAGQAVVLTKALGTGVIGQAIKKQLVADDELAAAVASMTTLNRDALAVGRRHGITACTDVTGFGLLGHLRNVLRGSNLSAVVELESLPLLPGALRHAAAGLIPGGSRANLDFVRPHLGHAPLSTDRDLLLTLATDAQTSGGLLLCIPAAHADACVADLRALGLPAARVATLSADAPGTIRI